MDECNLSPNRTINVRCCDVNAASAKKKLRLTQEKPAGRYQRISLLEQDVMKILYSRVDDFSAEYYEHDFDPRYKARANVGNS
jgi:hypothetical protein